jgi:hypothetical protein
MFVAQPFLYLTLNSNKTVTLNNYPGFTMKLPAGTQFDSLPVKIGFYDPTTGWKHIGDMTLTGRTDIWALSWEAIQSRFWAGYGYGAFWSNPWGPATEIWDALNWRVPSSHSGVLELWLGLGFVGVALFAALLLRTFRRVTLELASNRREEALWRVGFFFIFVVHAATEPSIMEQTSISWVLFVALGIAPRVVSALPVTKKRARRPAPWSQRLPAERSSAPSAQQPISSFDRPWRRPWRGTSG